MLAIEPGNEISCYLKDYVVIDIETTGYVEDDACVTEISAIRVADGVVKESFSSLVNSKVEITKELAELTGITNDMVKNAPDIKSVLREFLSFIGDSVLVSHNIHFDFAFLYRDTIRSFGKTIGNDYIDTYAKAKECVSIQKPRTTHNVVDYYGIEKNTYQRTLGECYTVKRIYECLFNEEKV